MSESLDLQQLSAELKKAGAPWEMDAGTEMAQLTESERRVRLGVTPPAGETSLEEAIQLDANRKAPTAAEVMAESAAAGTPTTFDLRDVSGKDYSTPVRNQGACGSCVAFGSVAVMESTLKFSRKDANLAVDLSEAQMFYCHAAEEGRNCGNGWWPDKAFEKAKTKGVTFENYFPYTSGNQGCSLQSGWQQERATSLGHTKLGSRADIKKWISTRGSVTGCFIVYQDFFSYRSGVYKHVSGSSVGGHCVEIIGYDDVLQCWICKNSWGTNWGEGGYFRIGYGEAQIDTWLGPYGVNGVSLQQWNHNNKVSGLWTDQSDRNTYAYLSGIGWRKLATTSSAVQHTMLSQLACARTAGRNVDTLEQDQKLQQVYVK